MQPFSVIHYIWSLNFGGIEKCAIELATGQNQAGGIAPALLIGCKKGELQGLVLERKITSHYASLTSGWDVNPLKLLKVIRILNQYDIVHFHTFNPLIMLAALFSRPKIIYTVHGNFNYGKSIRWTDKIMNFLKKWFINKKSDGVTFNSIWSREQFKSKLQLTNPVQKVIYNGIRMPEHSMIGQKNQIVSEKVIRSQFVVGMSSRFNRSKRIERLIESFNEFVQGKDDVILVLVGDGEQRVNLEKMVEAMNIKDRVEFTGYQEQIYQWIGIFDIGVFPFRDEAFGLSVLECMSCDIPVIIFRDSGGTVELLDETMQEDIVNSKSELVNRLEYYYLLYRSGELQKNGRWRNRALKFQLAGMVSSFSEFYHTILTSNTK
jgi:glycosyltransferase involved in cell wall biosynthesis